MNQIQHAIPKHNYFGIIQAPFNKPLFELKQEPWEFINPKTNQPEAKAQLIDAGTVKLSELPESYCLLLYGMAKKQLIAALMAKFPQIAKTQTVQFFVFLKIDNQ